MAEWGCVGVCVCDFWLEMLRDKVGEGGLSEE